MSGGPVWPNAVAVIVYLSGLALSRSLRAA